MRVRQTIQKWSLYYKSRVLLVQLKQRASMAEQTELFLTFSMHYNTKNVIHTAISGKHLTNITVFYVCLYRDYLQRCLFNAIFFYSYTLKC